MFKIYSFQQYYIFMRFFKLSNDDANETGAKTESKKNSKFHMPEVCAA